jgi:hypothetical protein
VADVELVIVYSLDDFEAPEPSGAKQYDGRCPVVVEPLGGNLFRVAEPASLTPFGPLGPMLSLGEVIELDPLSDGVWTLVRVRDSPPLLSRTLSGIPRHWLGLGDVPSLLERLVQHGGAWEWVCGNLTMQCPREPGAEASIEPVHRALQELRSCPESDIVHRDPADPHRPNRSGTMRTDGLR